jgi:hypothetical protein
MIFHPADSDLLFVVGEYEVRMVQASSGLTIKTFPTEGITTTCETDAVALNPTGSVLYVATNFSKRLLGFACQGTKIAFNLDTTNDQLVTQAERDEQRVECLAYSPMSREFPILFYAGNTLSAPVCHDITNHHAGDKTPSTIIQPGANVDPFLGKLCETSVFSVSFLSGLFADHHFVFHVQISVLRRR